MEKNINFPDSDLEESFSFSCYEFDDDDDDNSDDESYIEIAIEPPPPPPITTTDKIDKPPELEFRISFSSHNLSDVKTQTETSSVSSRGSSSTSSRGAPKTETQPEGYGSRSSSEHSSPRKSINRRRSVQFPAANRVLNLIRSNLRLSPDTVERSVSTGRSDENRRLGIQNLSNWELVKNRKASKIMTVMNGGIMKFFIKLRSIKIRPVLSFVKPQKAASSSQAERPQQHITRSEEKVNLHRTPIKILDKQRDHKRSSSGMISLDAIKEAIVEAMSLSSTKKQTKSCPTSIKSSPINHKAGIQSHDQSRIYTRDNSVQAAIAHCKRSLGQMPC